MTATKSKKQILKAVNHPHLDMHYASGHEGGYWYFIYDNGGNIYETHSIFVMRLNWMELERWVSDAQEFIKSVESKTLERTASYENMSMIYLNMKDE